MKKKDAGDMTRSSWEVIHSYGEELEKRLRLKTFPVAVKMLEKEGDIPEGAKRPLRDFGYHLATCQAFSMSRREGMLIAMMKEDMWCPESVIGLGLAEPPEYFFDGHYRLPAVKTLEAGSVWAHEFPRFEAGKYIGVVSAPLTIANFEPDVVVIYCNSTQLKILLNAAGYKEGHELTCTVGAMGACVYSVVPTIQSGKCQVSVPCGGDKSYAMSQDDEMIFTSPMAKVEELLSAFKAFSEFGLRIPYAYRMQPEFEWIENYITVANMMGMDWVKSKAPSPRTLLYGMSEK